MMVYVDFLYNQSKVLPVFSQISSHRFIELVPESIRSDMPLSIYKYQDMQEAAFHVFLVTSTHSMRSYVDADDDDDDR